MEQQHVGKVCFPKENLPLGPGEYNPRLPDRNICTPFVGKRELFPADYKPFMSSVWSSEISEGKYWKKGQKGERYPLGGSRADFASVFHDNETRQPLDSKLRFCETPGPTLTHEPLLDSLKYDGRHKAHAVLLEKDRVERFKDCEPLKEYDPQHNSLHLVKRTKETFVPKVGHKNPFPSVTEEYQPHKSKGGPMSTQEDDEEKWKPKLTWDKPNKLNLKFDSSCYQKKEVPDIIRPTEINRRVKKDQFLKMMMTPIRYDSQAIGTSIDTRRFRGEV